MNFQDVLSTLQLSGQNPCVITGCENYTVGEIPYKTITSPIDGKVLGAVQMADDAGYEHAIAAANKAFEVWRKVPAPKRGEVVRQIGDALRTHKEALGALVTLEMGKIYQEGLGEVQEMIDICDFAVGLSRQLYGLTMHSERPDHRMYEQWHPLGVVGIISAFNFPVAVWSWNAMIAAVCGNVSIWKPSEKTPLTAIACMNIIQDVLKRNHLPEGVFNVVVGDSVIGQKMASDQRIPLVSATGSTRMGKAVSETVARRLGRSLLELGGNNAIIISEHADLNLAIPATLFGAVGTCGQRCTSTRRLIVQSSIYDEVKQKLLNAYGSLRSRIGNPMEPETLIGPLIDEMAVSLMQQTIKEVQDEGGKVLFGGEVIKDNYVVPALVEVENHYQSVQHETFAPILYLIRYETIEEALSLQNGVPQGLSSAIFTNNLRESEYFLSAQGSDCGIANINIGTSGAEIGGAFGGEKETGGGRESGSDAWKAYMRRQTNTINYSTALPLAQGIKFDL
ncbi:MAG: aldehyde dehydrogenase family protein [Rhodothermia bacterium]|nr:aldehyde dehydrogenase family protein [Rhodothermia bacterium]